MHIQYYKERHFRPAKVRVFFMANGRLKGFFGAQDMTVGNPLQVVTRFSVPLLIGNIAQLLYSTVDSVIVGRYVGDAALSAIGASSTVINLFLILFMAIGTGVTIMVSQYYGARQYEGLSYTIGNSISLILIATAFIMAVGTPLTRPMLRLINTPPESFELASVYMIIIFLGVGGNGLYNILSGVLRGLGESFFPLIVLLATTALNTVLDIIFVAVFQMGVAGAALATIISQILSSVACLIRLTKMRGLVNLSGRTLRIRREYMTRIISLGLPSGIQQGVTSLAFLFVQSLINSMGYLVAACCTAVMRVDAFAILPSFAFNTAAGTFTGQNIGAGKLDRVKQGSRAILTLSLSVSVVLVGLILIFGGRMLALFTQTQQVIDMGVRFLRIMAAGYIIICVSAVLGGAIRGAGDTIAPMWISLITNVALRVPLTFLFSFLTRTEAFPAGNPDIIYTTMLIAFSANSIATVIYYFKGKWKEKAIV